jgi:hypothetical protein
MSHQNFESVTEGSTSKEESDTPKLVAQSQPALNPPPNGGLEAWVQVVGAFMLFFNSWYVVSPHGHRDNY